MELPILSALRRRYPRVPGRASLGELLGRPVPMPADLGDVAGDDSRLLDVACLAHLADASDDLRVRDILRPGARLYRRAPDPSALFESRHAAHAALPELGASRPLRVLTFNVALLDRTYLGQRAVSPHIPERRAALRAPAQPCQAG